MLLPSYKKFIFVFLVLMTAIHLCKASDSKHSNEVTSRIKRQSTNNCGPLKQLLSEEETCYVNGILAVCPMLAESGTLIVKVCSGWYSLMDAGNTSYRCENGEWISITKRCQPDCGMINGLSSRFAVSQYPWVVTIYDSTNRYICTGTILSPYYILTDAQTFTNENGELNNKTDFKIVAGKFHKDILVAEDTTQTRNVKTVIMHEDYAGKGGNYDNDIALLELDEALDFTYEVAPVCVDWNVTYESYDFVDGSEGEVITWGYAKVNESLNNVVRGRTVTYSERKICWNDLPHKSRKYFTYNKFCAKYIDRSVNTCNEDNGRGLFFKSDAEKYFIRGVSTMFRSENSCTLNRYKLYTTVSNYLTWLRIQMEKNKNYYVHYQTSIRYSDSCVLPEHVQYGKYAITNGKVYVVNKRVYYNTVISLRCNEADDSEYFYACTANETWTPSIEGVKCDKPGSCPPLRDSISEEVFCNLNGRPISCETPTHNVIAIAFCRPFYTSKESRLVYKCENGKWNQTFTHCIPECGLEEMSDTPFVANNANTYSRRLPWVVSIYDSFNNFECFGTIISPYHVLTVASCLSDSNWKPKNESSYTVIANKSYRDVNIIEESSQTKKIKIITFPISYNGDYQDNIALIELEEQFSLSAKVRPICIDWSSLYEESDFKNSNEGLAAGLDLTKDNKNRTVQTISAPYWQKNTCVTKLRQNDWKYLSKLLCTGFTNNINKCFVLGGGLFFKSDGTKYFIRGISSVALPLDNCSWNTYALYTKVSDYLTWLMVHMKANKNLHMEFTTKNEEDDFSSGCVLPEHIRYGKFKMSNGEPYIKNKLVTSSTVIILSCDDNDNEESQKFYTCLSGQWLPSIINAKCKKPGTCPSIKTSESEEVFCKLNGLPINCDESSSNTIATVICKSFYTSSQYRPIYRCENGKWNQPFIPCYPDCGIKVVGAMTLVLGGNDTIQNEYPWVTAIYNSTNDQICGGTVISRSFVLSAAHCFATSTGETKNKDEYTIVAGKYYRDINILETSSQKRKIKTLLIHENYRGRYQKHRDDIALVELQEKLSLTFEVQPVCIDWENIYEEIDFVDGNQGVVTGWGHTREIGLPSDVLKKLVVPYRPRNLCIQELPADFRQQFYTTDKFCAGYRDKNTNVCSGDSGGGLYFKSDGRRYYIRGIVSLTAKSGVGCDANNYALYTRVSNYLSWLETKTRREL